MPNHSYFKRSGTAIWILMLLLSFFSCTTPSILVTQEQQAGDNLFNQNNYPEAIEHYKNMLDASRKLGVYRNLSMEADVHRKIANCYEMTGGYAKAERHIMLAMVSDSTESNLLNIIENHRMLGKIKLYQGLNFDAIGSFEKALEMSDGMDQSIKNLNKNSIAENRLALGQLYATMGRFDESLVLVGMALNLFKETGNNRGEMEAMFTMASVYFNYGDLDFSKNLTERSQALAEELRLSLSRHYNNYARISATTGKYEDAIRHEEMALSSANLNRIAAQRIWFTIRLGDLYHDLGDRERSVEYYKRAQALRDTINIESGSIKASIDLRTGDLLEAHNYFIGEGSDLGAGITYLRLAELAIEEYKSDRALELLNNAEELFVQSKNNLGISNTTLYKGICFAQKKNFARALDNFDLALSRKEFPEIQWQAHFQKGLIYETQDKPTKARDSYIESIRIIEQIRGNLTIEEFKNSFIENKVDVYDRLISLYLKLDQALLALEYTERAKARSFYEMLANKKINHSIGRSDSLIKEEQGKRFEIQQLYKQLQNTENISIQKSTTRDINRRTLTSELEAKQEEHNEILMKLKLINSEYTQIVAFSPVNNEEIMSELADNTSILTYWISAKEIYIWCVRGESIVQKSVSISRDDLMNTISDARTHIATNATTQAKIDLKKLYKILIEPVSSILQETDNLIIIPNKSLHFLPFQALIDKSDNYLINKFNISYEPSLSVHNWKQNIEVNNDLRLFGAALADVSVGFNIGLPGTEDELNKISPLFKNKLTAFGENSTETFVKQNIGEYNYIHLATHGIFNFDQAIYSFLLFPPSDVDDGRLTVHEVMELELDSRLVTLSACETGLGYLDRGDEMVGLSRSFLCAGSSAVIVSLWSVADYQTSLLMSKFYSYIKDYTLEESLAMAQKEVMKDYPNPFYWSPFILIGKGN